MKEFEGKKLLVIGSVPLERDIVERAHQMGAWVAVADYIEDSPAKEKADEKLLIDVFDTDALVQYCKQNNIDGVTTGFLDLTLPICCEVCNRVGLPYYVTPKMLSMSTNKIDFKETCNQYGIPVPKTVYCGKDIPEYILEELPYPVFIKPLDASGSKGAGVCFDREEAKKQFMIAKSFSSNEIALVEEYITGTEFLLDYVAVDGEFRLLSIFDRYMCDDRESARNYANLSVAPSKAIDMYLNGMNDRIIAMFKDLGFTDGLLFLQGHIDGEKIVFYEMGCRLGGSFYHLEERCIGLNPIDMTVRYAFTGRMIEDIRKIRDDISRFPEYAYSYNCLLGGTDETIADIKGLEVLNEIPSYVASIQHRSVGTHYQHDGKIVDKPLLTVYLATDDLEQAKKDIALLNDSIEAYNQEGKTLLMKRFDPEKL